MVEHEPAYAIEVGPIQPPSKGRRRRRRAVAVAAILVVGACAVALAGARLALPTGTPPTRVVLVDPDGALAIVDRLGRNRLLLSAPGTTFMFPAWSPDGSRVAAIGRSLDTVAVEVFPATVAGTGSTNATVLYSSASSAPFYVYWTPDGRGVTFLTSEDSEIALRSAPADASSEGAVLRTGAPMYWAWQDASHMLVHSGGDHGEVFLGEVGGDGSTLAAVSQEPGLFRSPAVTADGRLQAYAVAKPDGSGAVVVAASDGSASHEVPVFGPAAVAFAPDGSGLAFIGLDHAVEQAPSLPLGPLRIMDPGSGAVRTLLSSPTVAFFWAPDGRTIAAIAVATPASPGSALGVRSARLAAASSRSGVTALPAADAPGFDVELAFVDVATGTTRSARTVRITQLFVSQLLPYFDQYALSHHLWSPDGQSILLPVVTEAGTDALDMLPADGSGPRELAPGSIGFWSP